MWHITKVPLWTLTIPWAGQEVPPSHFVHWLHHWLIVFALDLCVVNVHLCRNSNGFFTIFILRIWANQLTRHFKSIHKSYNNSSDKGVHSLMTKRQTTTKDINEFVKNWFNLYGKTINSANFVQSIDSSLPSMYLMRPNGQ